MGEGGRAFKFFDLIALLSSSLLLMGPFNFRNPLSIFKTTVRDSYTGLIGRRPVKKLSDDTLRPGPLKTLEASFLTKFSLNEILPDTPPLSLSALEFLLPCVARWRPGAPENLGNLW